MKYLRIFTALIINSTSIQGQFSTVLIDSLTNEPIIHANLFFEGTNMGTISNSEGYLRFENNFGSMNEVMISHLGYESKRINTDNIKDTTFLAPITYKLEEVVVTNYYNTLLRAVAKFSIADKDQLFHRMYYKQYLKQNEIYVDYLEAILIETNNSKKDIYVESLRSKQNETEKYIDFEHLKIKTLINYITTSKLIASKTINVNFVDESIAEFQIEYFGKNILVTIDTKKNRVLELSYNGIDNQMPKPYGKSQKVWAKGKIRTFQPYIHGQNFKVKYDYMNEKPFIKFLKFEYKGTIENQDLTLTYFSTQILQSLGFTDKMIPAKKVKIKRGNNIKSINPKRLTPLKWDRTNKIYPTKSELVFLEKLKWE